MGGGGRGVIYWRRSRFCGATPGSSNRNGSVERRAMHVLETNRRDVTSRVGSARLERTKEGVIRDRGGLLMALLGLGGPEKA